jgi:hypothetical protein
MSIERVYCCGLYLPGHDVHYIQWKVATRRLMDPDSPSAPGHLLEVWPTGVVVVEVGGVVHRLWNHEPHRLERLVADNRGVISYQPRFHLLRTPLPEGCGLFCVAEADAASHLPCPPTPARGTPAELLQQAGGFLLPRGGPYA